MEKRLYFIIGDLCANALVATAAVALTAWLIGGSWGMLPGMLVGEGLEEMLGNDHAQDGVAEEFEAFVRVAVLESVGRMREGLLQPCGIVEGILEALLASGKFCGTDRFHSLH